MSQMALRYQSNFNVEYRVEARQKLRVGDIDVLTCKYAAQQPLNCTARHGTA